jgi:hypothetical protein
MTWVAGVVEECRQGEGDAEKGEKGEKKESENGVGRKLFFFSLRT